MQRVIPPHARTVTLAAVVAFAALTLAASPSVAQAGCPASITLAHETVDPFETGGTQDVVFLVANEHTLAEVVVTVRTQIAEGWQVEPAEATVTVAPGEEMPVQLAVTASGNEGEAAQLNAQAQGVCSAGGTPFPISGAATTNTATDTLVLETVMPQRLPFPDIGAIPPQYFLGGLGLVAVVVGAVFAMQRTSQGFQVTCPEPEKHLRAGRGTSFPLELRNRGREPDTAQFEVGDVPAGWNAFMALPELTLAGGESRTLWLMVRAPPDATAESSAVVPVTVRSKDAPKQTGQAVVRAVVKDLPDGEDVEGTQVS